MKKIILLILASFFYQSTSLAKSPQQYCEALEARQASSFEMLNVTLDGSVPTLTSTTVSRVKLVGNHNDQSFSNNSGLPITVSIQACDVSYTLTIPFGATWSNYAGNRFTVSGGTQSGQTIATFKVDYNIDLTKMPLCPNLTATGNACTGTSCFPGGETTYTDHGTSVTRHIFDNAQVSVPSIVNQNCMTRSGIQYKNGNSCVVSNFKVKSTVTMANLVDGNGVPYQLPDYGIEFSADETKTDSVTKAEVKYCTRGNFMVAVARTGPMAQKYDSVVTCMSATGEGRPGLLSVQPIQGELTTNLKNWLQTREGCVSATAGQ